jgi:4-hydroxymandelate oxidase
MNATRLPAVDSAAAYEALAKDCLPPEAWVYLAAGEGSYANCAAYAELPLTPRVLTDVRGGHTRCVLFGQSLAHPILLAPVAYQRWFNPQGEAAAVLAAASQGGVAVVSSLASQPLEQITAGLTPDMPRPWFQLYWQGERAATSRLLARAEAAGYAAIVFTVDAPVKAASVRLPADVAAVNLEAPLSPAPVGQEQSMVFDGWMARAPTWEDLAWLRAQTRLPLLVKGVLHPEDAERALDLGADGLIVSNHGGRILSAAPASIRVLPAISARVDGRVPVLLDSGIRSGSDVLRALALGASAVLVGRPYIWGLAVAGALGVAHVIRLLRDELELAMALCGMRELVIREQIPICLDM